MFQDKLFQKVESQLPTEAQVVQCSPDLEKGRGEGNSHLKAPNMEEKYIGST